MPDGPGPATSISERRYDVGAAFAAGGMATIHRAFDRWSQREVAYKRARFGNEANRARMTALFRREYDTLARLAHPNIVAVHDYGFDQDGPYYTMELLTGEDLAQRAPLPFQEVCAVLRDLASALALVHARGLVHRDVSPNNVRLTGDGRAKLLDFGALTPFGKPSELVGTPAFIAPECLSVEGIDGRVDLYGLGALAYWALTRRLAVAAQSLDELPAAWARPIAAPSQFVPEIPAELDALVLSLLQRDPGARPVSAGEVIERLTTIGEVPPERAESEIALSYLKHPPLQDRDEALRLFDRKLDGLGAARGGVLMIEGGPGSGRSALLTQLALEARLRGMAILSTEGKIHKHPLSAVTQLIGAGLALYPELAASFRGRHGSFDAAIEDQSAMGAAERHALIAGSLQETLLAFAERGPLVITVDDADAVDEPSLALLASLIETIGDRRILLALARGIAAPRRDAEAVLRAGAQRLTLEALRPHAVSELVRAVFGDVPNARWVAQWLHRQSGGNPAHCVDLMAMLLRRGEVRYTRGTFTLPAQLADELGNESVEGLLLERLDGIGADAERIVKVLSLSHGALTVSQLVEASGFPAPLVLEALHRLRDRNLSVEASGSHNLASPALRARVAEGLGDDERRALHRALARVLQLGEAPLDDRLAAGVHLIRAGEASELEGAALIGRLAVEHAVQVATGAGARLALESALEVYARRGYSDRECVHLLFPLTVSGFYGELSAQRRYLDRTMTAHAELTGLALAVRLRPFLGAKLALIVGLLTALVCGMFRPTRGFKAPLRKYLENFMSIASSATAAAACALDTAEAQRVVAWLEPLAVARPNSSLQIARQFCLAVAETSSGHVDRALERYEDVNRRLAAPVPGMLDSVREQLRYGALHGIAQALLDMDPERAVDAAIELGRESLYFAPHAESIRMSYHLGRGERAAAEAHRARAEALAMLGGVSWSSVSLLTARAYVGAVLTGDVVSLVRVVAELQRQAHLSPGLATHSELAGADLMRLRGQPAEALAIYERVLSNKAARRLPGTYLLRAVYVQTLSELGRYEEAKRAGEEAVAELETFGVRVPYRYYVRQELAQAELALGNVDAARAMIDGLLSELGEEDNPLILGSLHRDRAELALVTEDREEFERSFAIMKQAFTRTENPYLLRQCEALHSRAVRKGVRAAVASAETSVGELLTTLDGETAIEPRGSDPSLEVIAKGA